MSHVEGIFIMKGRIQIYDNGNKFDCLFSDIKKKTDGTYIIEAKRLI